MMRCIYAANVTITVKTSRQYYILDGSDSMTKTKTVDIDSDHHLLSKIIGNASRIFFVFIFFVHHAMYFRDHPVTDRVIADDGPAAQARATD